MDVQLDTSCQADQELQLHVLTVWQSVVKLPEQLPEPYVSEQLATLLQLEYDPQLHPPTV